MTSATSRRLLAFDRAVFGRRFVGAIHLALDEGWMTHCLTDEGNPFDRVHRFMVGVDHRDGYLSLFRIVAGPFALFFSSERLAEVGEDCPYVCPGCYSVGGEPCAPGCIDDEMRERDRHSDDLGDEGDES